MQHQPLFSSSFLAVVVLAITWVVGGPSRTASCYGLMMMEHQSTTRKRVGLSNNNGLKRRRRPPLHMMAQQRRPLGVPNVDFKVIRTTTEKTICTSLTRRRTLSWISGTAAASLLVPAVCSLQPAAASAAEENDDNNSYIPPGPVERSGLVVLRVAEVAAFQEKIIRAILNNDITDVVISPQQIVFGTQILLKNSNLAGNMKLMIDKEIPRTNRRSASKQAADAMNTIQTISSTAAAVQRPFTDLELLQIAELYRDLRLQLNALYECLSPAGKEKYYGYFMAVTEYEKKIAEGTYNPELDGVLRFDDDEK